VKSSSTSSACRSSRKTATGARSTDEEVLEKLAEDYPLPAKILEHRWPVQAQGHLHRQAGPAGAAAHRPGAHPLRAGGSGDRAPVQQRPQPAEHPDPHAEGRRVREAFVAPPGCLIASADYSQIELRIMAHLSWRRSPAGAPFRQGQDVHRATAAEVFGVAPEQVSSEQRRYAKVINFGLIYGMSAFGLAKNLGIETKAAAAYIDRYFQRYPGVKRYMDETSADGQGPGLRRDGVRPAPVLPEINSAQRPAPRRRRARGDQCADAGHGGGPDQDGMVAVQHTLDRDQRATKMIMQVHDELVFEVPEAEVDWLRTEIPRLMAGVAELSVPLLAEVGVGANWEAAH
jgi:DNA polymerase-1